MASRVENLDTTPHYYKAGVNGADVTGIVLPHLKTRQALVSVYASFCKARGLNSRDKEAQVLFMSYVKSGSDAEARRAMALKKHGYELPREQMRKIKLEEDERLKEFKKTPKRRTNPFNRHLQHAQIQAHIEKTQSHTMKILDVGGGHAKFLVRACTRKYRTEKGASCRLQYVCLDTDPEAKVRFNTVYNQLTSPAELISSRGHDCDLRIVDDYVTALNSIDDKFDLILVNNITFPAAKYKLFVSRLVEMCTGMISMINMDGDFVRHLPTNYADAAIKVDERGMDDQGNIRVSVVIDGEKYTEYLITSDMIEFPNTKYTAKDYMVQFGGMSPRSPCTSTHSSFCVREIKVEECRPAFSHDLRKGCIPTQYIEADFAGIAPNVHAASIRIASPMASRWVIAEDMYVSLKLDGEFCYSFYDIKNQYFCFRDGTKYSIPRLSFANEVDLFVGNLEFFGVKTQSRIRGWFYIIDLYECNASLGFTFWEELEASCYLSSRYKFLGVKQYFARNEIASFAEKCESKLRYDGFVFRSAAIRNTTTMNASFYTKPFIAIDVRISDGRVVTGPSRAIGKELTGVPDGLHELALADGDFYHQKPRRDKTTVTSNRTLDEYLKSPRSEVLLGRFFGAYVRPPEYNEFIGARKGRGMRLYYICLDVDPLAVSYDGTSDTFRSPYRVGASTIAEAAYDGDLFQLYNSLEVDAATMVLNDPLT